MLGSAKGSPSAFLSPCWDGSLHLAQCRSTRTAGRRLGRPQPGCLAAGLRQVQLRVARSGLVFTTKTGRPVEPRNLVRSFHRICGGNKAPADQGPSPTAHDRDPAQEPRRPGSRRADHPRPLAACRHLGDLHPRGPPGPARSTRPDQRSTGARQRAACGRRERRRIGVKRGCQPPVDLRPWRRFGWCARQDSNPRPAA